MVMTEMEALREKARAHDESANISAEMLKHRKSGVIEVDSMDDYAESLYHKGVANGIKFALAKLTGENKYPNLRASFWVERLKDYGHYAHKHKETA